MSGSPLYETLAITATEWVTATRPNTEGSNDIDINRIYSRLAPSAILRFGHKHFVSTAPHLQRDESPRDFVARLKSMSAAFQTWSIDVQDVSVDTEKKSAVIRSVFHMQAKNDPEVIHNEILFWCQMDDNGENVIRSTEFVDPMALQALAPKLKAATASSG